MPDHSWRLWLCSRQHVTLVGKECKDTVVSLGRRHIQGVCTQKQTKSVMRR